MYLKPSSILCNPNSCHVISAYRSESLAELVHEHSSQQTFHHYLKQYNNRWFLFGLQQNEDKEDYITNMALDRIVSFCPMSNVDFIPNRDIDFTTRFKDVVGVTIPEDHPEPEEVLLKFDFARFPYIVSKPMHTSQTVVSEEDHIVSIFVRPNKELEALIFSFGNQVEVIKPMWLRQQISDKIEETFKIY